MRVGRGDSVTRKDDTDVEIRFAMSLNWDGKRGNLSRRILYPFAVYMHPFVGNFVGYCNWYLSRNVIF